MLEDSFINNGKDSENAARSEDKRGADALFIHGSVFINSAAKFWSSLIDELATDHPQCDAIEMETLTDVRLTRNLLFPEASLHHEFNESFSIKSIEQTLNEALAELIITGPPDAVRARLLQGEKEHKKCNLPFDCVDADVFAFLMAWLLEWAEIPEIFWNSEKTEGWFNARDRERKLLYELDISMSNKHVSEGLFRRTLILRYVREGEKRR